MTHSFNRSTRVALTALFAVASINAVAQTSAAPQLPAAGAMRVHGDMQGNMQGNMHRPDPAKMQAMMAKRQSDLKAKLSITPAQEPAWAAYAAAMQSPADLVKPADMQAQRAELDKLPTPERIDKMRALRAERTAKMNASADKRDAATKSFYAALAPEQQKTFDAERKSYGGYGERGGRGDADRKKS